MVGRRRSFFPDPRTADPTGLVAVTPGMNTAMLLDAYQHGIFPWSDRPVRWYSPNPRAVFFRTGIRLPSRLGKIMRRFGFHITFDMAFTQVMRGCAEAHKPAGGWISEGFVDVYSELHKMGYAHSVETWQNDVLVGGLYGVHVRGLYAGESMFYRVDNASKVAFAYLVAQLDKLGVVLMDAQVLNAHTERLGAVNVSRDEYLRLLNHAMSVENDEAGHKWNISADLVKI